MLLICVWYLTCLFFAPLHYEMCQVRNPPGCKDHCVIRPRKSQWKLLQWFPACSSTPLLFQQWNRNLLASKTLKAQPWEEERTRERRRNIPSSQMSHGGWSVWRSTRAEREGKEKEREELFPTVFFLLPNTNFKQNVLTYTLQAANECSDKHRRAIKDK